MELELVDPSGIALDIVGYRPGGVLVVLGFGQFEQLPCPGQAFAQFADAIDRLVQQGALAAQRLCAFWIVPDLGIAELALDFLQALALGVVVKDTPSAHPADRTGRRCAGGRD